MKAAFAVRGVIPPVAVSRCEVKEEVAVASFSCRYSSHVSLYSVSSHSPCGEERQIESNQVRYEEVR